MSTTAFGTAMASVERAQMRWAGTCALCWDSRELVLSARARISLSRAALLLPLRRRISGGAPPPDQGVRVRVLSRLEKGDLFLVDARAFAYPGTGQLCIVCDQAISKTDTEQEIEGPNGPVFAHRLCYLVWLQESDARRSEREVIVKILGADGLKVKVVDDSTQAASGGPPPDQ